MNFIFSILSFILILVCSTAKIFPHIIWLYWDKGYQYMGGFEKLCVSRIIQVHQGTDWQVQLVQQNTLKKWLNQSNYQNIQKIMNPNSGVNIQGQSDFIRYYLLLQHGGVWIDASVLLYENLNWLDGISTNPLVIHKNVFKNPQVFFFSTFWGESKGQSKIIKYYGQKIHPILNFQSSFIAAIKQSTYIKDQIQIMNFLVQQKSDGFYRLKYYYSFQYQFNEYWRVYAAHQISQYKKYQEFQNGLHQNNDVQSNLHKLYQVLTISKNKILYHIQQNQTYFRYFFQPQGRPFGNYGKYLRKFNHFGHKQIIDGVLSQDYKQIEYKLTVGQKEDFEFSMKYLTQDYKCLQYYQIRQQSIINKYLLFNYSLAKTLYPTMKVVKQSELPYICRWTDLKKIRAVFPIIFNWAIYGVILFVVTQLAVELSLHVFSNKGKIMSSQSKSQKKRQVWRKLLLFTTIYEEKDLIMNQFTLWLLQSPTAFLVIIILTVWCIFFIKFGIGKHSSRWNIIKSKNFQIYFCIMIIIQYIIQYNSTIWKYQGQVYNYFKLQEQNQITIQNSQIFTIKILILVLIYYLLLIIKKIFLLQYVDKQQQNYSLVQ